jgi:tol-pal system protein YbgF
MMFRPLTGLAFTALLASALSLPAQAQYSDSSDTPPEVSNTARMDVRISQLEEQMRRMEGTIEQLSFENKQLKGQLDKSAADTQYRLQALEKQAASAQQPAAPAPAAGQPPADNADQMQPVQPAPGAENRVDTASPASPQFASARDHYNYAFRLMNQAKYAEAGSSFAAFTHQYPHDPLIGNAFYWLGETYYVRRDYVRAADNFRQGYEAMPSGPKAADNLLKLAMSLEALKKDKEACVVLRQVASKYDGAGSVKPRAEQEMNRIGCN